MVYFFDEDESRRILVGEGEGGLRNRGLRPLRLGFVGLKLMARPRGG